MAKALGWFPATNRFPRLSKLNLFKTLTPVGRMSVMDCWHNVPLLVSNSNKSSVEVVHNLWCRASNCKSMQTNDGMFSLLKMACWEETLFVWWLNLMIPCPMVPIHRQWLMVSSTMEDGATSSDHPVSSNCMVLGLKRSKPPDHCAIHNRCWLSSKMSETYLESPFQSEGKELSNWCWAENSKIFLLDVNQ